ncbi:MAG: 4-hydroxythreonine-4-phosphate dehydrogenase PdxA [Ignavibacteriaceae bacterium]
MNRFVFTCGDINGIGPEIAIKSLNRITKKDKKSSFILVIPEKVFENTSELIRPTFKSYSVGDRNSLASSTDQVKVLIIDSFKQSIGKPTIQSGRASYLALQSAFNLIKNDLADVVITAPVSKTALNLAGSKYPGQTEMFADWSKVKNFVMTFLSDELRVALYSIHIPLNKVANSLQTKEFKNKLNVLLNMLNVDLNIKKPTIAVLGVNPHAGENGIIGNEENEILKRVINLNQYKGFVEGPFPADAFFARRKFKDFDMTLGIYHDQVLIPFKYINAGMGVNYTAGLNIIRTSPDHGTAYDIAGKGIADESSMIEAFKYAKVILKNRKNRRR